MCVCVQCGWCERCVCVVCVCERCVCVQYGLCEVCMCECVCVCAVLSINNLKGCTYMYGSTCSNLMITSLYS